MRVVLRERGRHPDYPDRCDESVLEPMLKRMTGGIPDMEVGSGISRDLYFINGDDHHVLAVTSMGGVTDIAYSYTVWNRTDDQNRSVYNLLEIDRPIAEIMRESELQSRSTE